MSARITEAMVEAALAGYVKSANIDPEKHLDWLRPAMRAALAAALSTETGEAEGWKPIESALPTIRERLANWIGDFLGINRYTIAWDFDHNGVRLAGRYEARYTTNGMSKRFAKRMVRTMNRAYDTTGHWVVPFSTRQALESDNAG